MNKLRSVLLVGMFFVPTTLILVGGRTSSDKDAQIARGKYLVGITGCSDCHTPLKMTDAGPVPDMSRWLSGHPEKRFSHRPS
jgi:mono/diheme cytochrome c family protein